MDATTKQGEARTLTRDELLAALPRYRWYWGSEAKRHFEKLAGTPAEMWAKSERGDILLWLAAWAGIDRRQVVGAACAVARQALKYVPPGEERPRIALETAEAWARGEPGVTLLQVRTAAAAADAAAAAADAAAAAAADAWRLKRAESLKASADLVRSKISWADVEASLLR